ELLEDPDRATVLEFFERYRVARPGQSLRAELQTLHGAVGDDHVLDWRTHAVIVCEAFDRDAAQLGQTVWVWIMGQLLAHARENPLSSLTQFAGRKHPGIRIPSAEIEFPRHDHTILPRPPRGTLFVGGVGSVRREAPLYG